MMEVSVFMIISSILLFIETLVGLGANGFIVLMNYIDWFRSRKLSSNDQILTCLGLSRIAWLAAVTLNITADYFSVKKDNCRYAFLMLPILWIFANTASTLFATCLSVFYLTKIATFSNPVFLQVKLRFLGVVPWLLLGSVLFSAITTITLVTSLSNGFSMCVSDSSLLNISDSGIKFPVLYRYIDFLATTPNLIPNMIFLSSSILLMTSLWMHRRRMQRSGAGIQDLNTQVHLTAIKALASFAVLYLSSFLAVVAQAVMFWNNMTDTWFYTLLGNVAVSSPSGHAVILILINPKLKQRWVRMLLHLKHCLVKCPLKTYHKTIEKGHPLVQKGL